MRREARYMASVNIDRSRQKLLSDIASRFGTPVYVYDAQVLRRQLTALNRFDRIRFAQKACPNIHIQRVLRGEGAWVDCVSLGELERAFRAGFTRDEIVFTADILTEAAIDRLAATGVAVNAGSEDMIAQIGRRSRGHKLWLRVNPGFGHGHSQKVNTGGESSKHGIWHENVARALELVDAHGLDLVGFHMHIGSGTDLHHLQRVCDAMAALVERLGRDIRAVSGGGGLPVPYRRGDTELDVDAHFRCWDVARKRIEASVGHAIELEIEPGRFLVAQAGVLLAEVRATKQAGENHFTLVDAGFNDLVRPAMYGAHHEVSVIARGPEEAAQQRKTVIAGPLCESGDVFTQDGTGKVVPRDLPRAKVGDLLVFHDAGAYGASMSSNYNSRPLAPEVLIDGEEVRLIRRRQSMDELLALEDV